MFLLDITYSPAPSYSSERLKEQDKNRENGKKRMIDLLHTKIME
jgi:hypothetical protein